MATLPDPSRGPVLSIGEILIDMIVDDKATSLETARGFVARPGGAPANTAVALARLGVPSAFCGVVGNDPFGSRLTAGLDREGVDASRLRQTDRAATTLAFAWKDERGDGHFWLLRGADSLLSSSDIAGSGIDQVAALVVGSVALAAEPSRGAVRLAVQVARESGVPVFFDVNVRPSIWANPAEAAEICYDTASQSEVVKLSLDDAAALMGASTPPDTVADSFLALGPRFIVLTDGERGCWLATQDEPELRFVPPYAVPAVEPTGAGDAFGAALLARCLENKWQLPGLDDIRYAAAAGALATTKPGAWEGLPNRQELQSFLAAQ